MIRHKQYLKAVCDEDAIRIDGIRRDSRKVGMYIRSIARNESTVASEKTLIRDMKEYDDEQVSEMTAYDYRIILDRLNILHPQESFNVNLRSSTLVGKTPKRHLTDPSLSMAALGMDIESAMDDLKTYGFMFEAMCERDLEIYADVHGGELKHYRDNRGREIDAVVKMPGGTWGAFEIKLGVHQIDSAAENLLKMEKLFEDAGHKPAFLCVICGMAPTAFRRDDGVFVVPPTMLGP